MMKTGRSKTFTALGNNLQEYDASNFFKKTISELGQNTDGNVPAAEVIGWHANSQELISIQDYCY